MTCTTPPRPRWNACTVNELLDMANTLYFLGSTNRGTSDIRNMNKRKKFETLLKKFKNETPSQILILSGYQVDQLQPTPGKREPLYCGFAHPINSFVPMTSRTRTRWKVKQPMHPKPQYTVQCGPSRFQCEVHTPKLSKKYAHFACVHCPLIHLGSIWYKSVLCSASPPSVRVPCMHNDPTSHKYYMLIGDWIPNSFTLIVWFDYCSIKFLRSI